MFGHFRSRLSSARPAFVSGIASAAYMAACIAVAGWGVHNYVGQAIVVQGASMVPTIRPCCAVVWCDIWSMRRSPPRVGEVVSAFVWDGKSEGGLSSVVKRVAGVAGDIVNDPITGLAAIVPEGHVWLLGDNLRESRDSRVYGPVSLSSVKARVSVR